MKRPIDKLREGAGQAMIGDDGAPIVRPITFADSLYLVTTTAVYRVRMADEVDPKRLNINVPKTLQQKIISYGANKEFVSVTLIAAAELFTKTALGDSFDIDTAIGTSLDSAVQLAELFDVTEELGKKQDAVEQKLKASQFDRQQFSIPHTENLKKLGGQSLAALWRVSMNIIKIAEMFYPKITHNQPWKENISKQMLSGLDDGHALHQDLPIMIGIIESFIDYRNAFIHPDDSKGVSFYDYDLNHDLTISPQTIEIKHPRSPIPRVILKQFCEFQLEEICTVAETFLFWLCELNASGHPLFEHHVEKLPEDKPHSGSPLRWNIQFKGTLPPEGGSMTVQPSNESET